MRPLVTALIALCAQLGWSAVARGQSDPEPTPVTGSTPEGAKPAEPSKAADKAPSYPVDEDAPIADNAERELPDYDGLPESTSTGDVLLWIPRVLFSPLYLVSEYVIRRPLGALITVAERDNWAEAVADFFTFGPDDSMGLVPTGLIDFGLRPSIGLYYFWNEAGHRNNAVRARAAYGGDDWRSLEITDRVSIGPDADVALGGEITLRPDYVFYGLGPRSSGDDPRYLRQDLRGQLSYSSYLQPRPHGVPKTHAAQPSESKLNASVGIRDVRFDMAEGCCDDDSVQSQVDAGRFPAPPGSRDGYTIAFQQLDVSLDSRRRREQLFDVEASDWTQPPGSGVRFNLRGEHASGLRATSPTLTSTTSERQAWIKYGATLGGFWDVTEQQRVLGLQLIVDFVDPLLEGSEIPFTEQVSLGGDRPMRGFLEGRLIDRSSAVLLFDYTWPIWVWLDGALHYAVGNVFGEHLDGLEPGLLRQSAGLGIRAVGARDHVLELLVAFGSKPFDEGGEPESLRVVLGATSGF